MHWDAIGIIGIGSLIIGGILFFLMRWWFMRSAKKPSLRKVTIKELPYIVLFVSGFLVLVWFVEAGSKIAAVILAVLTLLVVLAKAFMVKRQRDNE